MISAVVALKQNPESTVSETETRRIKNVVDSEMRPSKSGLKISLKYDTTTVELNWNNAYELKVQTTAALS